MNLVSRVAQTRSRGPASGGKVDVEVAVDVDRAWITRSRRALRSPAALRFVTSAAIRAGGGVDTGRARASPRAADGVLRFRRQYSFYVLILKGTVAYHTYFELTVLRYRGVEVGSRIRVASRCEMSVIMRQPKTHGRAVDPDS